MGVWGFGVLGFRSEGSGREGRSRSEVVREVDFEGGFCKDFGLGFALFLLELGYKCVDLRDLGVVSDFVQLGH